jgi:DNA-binding Xre family transcriptional regulator
MSKEMISIPEGNLMRVAAIKGITTISDLKQRTTVDRKTLSAIDKGKPVKQTTLQSIADKLRVPIEHLQASNAVDATDTVSGDEFQYREIKLQRLDGPALRKLADETNERNWVLNIDKLPAELEAALLKLRKTLDQWFEGMKMGFDPEWGHEGVDNLLDQIEHMKISADIDKSVEELAQHKLKIFGGTYVAWQMGWGEALEYHSHLTAALKITTEDTANSTLRVCIGRVPPQSFSAGQIAHLESKTGRWRWDRIEIDGAVVWSRNQPREDDL